MVKRCLWYWLRHRWQLLPEYASLLRSGKKYQHGKCAVGQPSVWDEAWNVSSPGWRYSLPVRNPRQSIKGKHRQPNVDRWPTSETSLLGIRLWAWDYCSRRKQALRRLNAHVRGWQQTWRCTKASNSIGQYRIAYVIGARCSLQRVNYKNQLQFI